MSPALQAIRRFRLHELNGLRTHIQRFGPLSSPAKAEAAQQLGSTSNAHLPHVLPNPFFPRLNPKTGRWAPPKYSIRRQAELIKAAKVCGMVNLLPPGPKLRNPEFASSIVDTSDSQDLSSNSGQSLNAVEDWAMPVLWIGEVKKKDTVENAAISRLYSGRKRMFKGHKWERVMASRLETRKVLMGTMKKRILKFKQYHRRRRPNPLKPARSAKSPKLPF